MINKLHAFMDKQKRALEMLFRDGPGMAYLMVLYATIDTMGFITAENEADPVNSRFRAFAKKYLVPYLQGDVNEDDLWGARCAILHTATPESNYSRQGRARQILYSCGVEKSLCERVISAHATPHRYVAVSLEKLRDSLLAAYVTLINEMETNPALRQRWLDRVNRLYVYVPDMRPKEKTEN